MSLIAKEIINTNNFMSLATSYQNDTWIAPVYYTTDDNYTFYFVSSKYSKHVQHIFLNSQVAISIFNSNQTEGTANGVQIKGIATIINESEYFNIIKLFGNKMKVKINNNDIIDKIKEYSRNNRLIFSINPIKSYIQDQEFFKKHHIDKRIEIHL